MVQDRELRRYTESVGTVILFPGCEPLEGLVVKEGKRTQRRVQGERERTEEWSGEKRERRLNDSEKEERVGREKREERRKEK